MFCYKCGNKLPNNVLFCNKCGAKTINGYIHKQTNPPISLQPAKIEQTAAKETVIINEKYYDIANTTSLRIDTAIIDEDMMNIVKLVNLTSLHLEKLNICNIAPLACLSNLTELDLSFNQISDLTPISNLSNLTQLWLWGNKITDLNPLMRLTQLTFLSLNYNKIRDIVPLIYLKNLNWLGLGNNNISGRKQKWLQSQLPQCKIFL